MHIKKIKKNKILQKRNSNTRRDVHMFEFSRLEQVQSRDIIRRDRSEKQVNSHKELKTPHRVA